jgi:hypothetical protein
MNLEDYNNIRELIDDIIGINTKQGDILKTAIKNYFEDKPQKAKLTTRIVKQTPFMSNRVKEIINDSEEAMKRFTIKLSKANRRK